MNRKVPKVSHKFKDSHCCVCNQEGLGQFSNIKDKFVNIRGSLVSYGKILESSLNCQNIDGEDLELCESCKNTIIPFYLLKLKLDETNPLPETPYDFREKLNKACVISISGSEFIKLEPLNAGSCKESEEKCNLEPKKKKCRPNRIEWVEQKDFSRYEEAIHFMKAQKIWSVKHTKPPTKNGEKRQYFRCNQVPKNQRHQCPCVATLLTKHDGSTFLFQSAQAHDHSKERRETE